MRFTARLFYRGLCARRCYDFAMSGTASAASLPARLRRHWRQLWCALALLTALPTVYIANQALLQTKLELSTRLIVQNSLWESDATYAGKPRDWTRFAAWLLDANQLLERARARHPAQADAIEEDFRRDSLLAFGAVIARYLAWWGIPCGVAFATGIWLERRRPAPR